MTESNTPKKAAKPAAAKKAEKKVGSWCAISRSGITNVRKGTGNERFAVDVETEGLSESRRYRIFRAFSTEAAAQAFADACNGGKHPDAKLAKRLKNAIVVPAWETPGTDQPWPWETTAGKAALAKAQGKKAPRKAPAKKAPAKSAAAKAPAEAAAS